MLNCEADEASSGAEHRRILIDLRRSAFRGSKWWEILNLGADFLGSNQQHFPFWFSTPLSRHVHVPDSCRSLVWNLADACRSSRSDLKCAEGLGKAHTHTYTLCPLTRRQTQFRYVQSPAQRWSSCLLFIFGLTFSQHSECRQQRVRQQVLTRNGQMAWW